MINCVNLYQVICYKQAFHHSIVTPPHPPNPRSPQKNWAKYYQNDPNEPQMSQVMS